MKCCAYYIDHIYALPIENTSESNPRSCEATKAVTKKAQKNSEASWGFEPMTSPDTGAMLYQLSYEASPEADQAEVQLSRLQLL